MYPITAALIGYIRALIGYMFALVGYIRALMTTFLQYLVA